MLAYYVVGSKEAPECLKGMKTLRWDRPNGDTVFHLDILGTPSIEVPERPVFEKNRIDEKTFFFEFGPNPKPIDLLKRKPPLSPIGKPIKLGDENDWIIPVVRNIGDGSELPYREKMSYGGQMVKIKPEFLPAYEAGKKIWDWIDGTNRPTTKFEYWKVYSDILSVNYYITPYDVCTYGLRDSDFEPAFFRQAIDWELFLKLSKESEAKKPLPL